MCQQHLRPSQKKQTRKARYPHAISVRLLRDMYPNHRQNPSPCLAFTSLQCIQEHKCAQSRAPTHNQTNQNATMLKCSSSASDEPFTCAIRKAKEGGRVRAADGGKTVVNVFLPQGQRRRDHDIETRTRTSNGAEQLVPRSAKNTDDMHRRLGSVIHSSSVTCTAWFHLE